MPLVTSIILNLTLSKLFIDSFQAISQDRGKKIYQSYWGYIKNNNQLIDLISPFFAGCHDGDTDEEIFQSQGHPEQYVGDTQKAWKDAVFLVPGSLAATGFVKIVEEIKSRHTQYFPGKCFLIFGKFNQKTSFERNHASSVHSSQSNN